MGIVSQTRTQSEVVLIHKSLALGELVSAHRVHSIATAGLCSFPVHGRAHDIRRAKMKRARSIHASDLRRNEKKPQPLAWKNVPLDSVLPGGDRLAHFIHIQNAADVVLYEIFEWIGPDHLILGLGSTNTYWQRTVKDYVDTVWRHDYIVRFYQRLVECITKVKMPCNGGALSSDYYRLVQAVRVLGTTGDIKSAGIPKRLVGDYECHDAVIPAFYHPHIAQKSETRYDYMRPDLTVWYNSERNMLFAYTTQTPRKVDKICMLSFYLDSVTGSVYSILDYKITFTVNWRPQWMTDITRETTTSHVWTASFTYDDRPLFNMYDSRYDLARIFTPTLRIRKNRATWRRK